MSAVQVVDQLLARLNPADAARVLAALRQDDLVWQDITRLDLVDKVAAGPQDGLEQWAPVNFALAALDTGLHAFDLRAIATVNLPEDQLQYALTTLSGLNANSKVTASLLGAGLIALALRERFRLAHHWPAVFDVSTLNESAALSPLAPVWRAGILCLYALLSEPDDMLQALVARLPVGLGADWAVHCLLANPTSEENQQQRLLRLFASFEIGNQVEGLKSLQSSGQPELARFVARTLLDTQPAASAALLEPVSLLESNATAFGERLLRLQQRAVLHTLAGDYEQAGALLDLAAQIASHTLAGCQVRLNAVSGSPEVQWSPDLLNAALRSPAIQSDLDFTDPGASWDAALLETSCEDTLHPLLALRKARLLIDQGDLLRGHEIARASARRLVAQAADGQLPHSPFSWDPVETLHEFARLDLLEEAAQVAGAVTSVRPADVRLLSATGRVYQQCGDLDRAIEAALLCVCLSPGAVAHLKRLAELYETIEDWQNALSTREKWLALLPDIRVEDRLSLASAALKAGQVIRSREICQQVLSEDPDSGLGHALLGQICLTEGDLNTAINHLSQATLLVPEQPRPWLQLAQVLRDHGQPQQSLETLRAAVMAVPDSAELLFALANACLADNMPSEALPALRDASRLDPDSPDIAAAYAEVLHDLGHCPEARHLLQQARRRWPSHARLAAVNGRTLIEAGDLEAALPAFETALKAPHPEPVWYLWYARALLLDDRQAIPGGGLDDTRLEQAYLALQKAAALLGDNFEANVLMAEVLRARKSADQAYELYKFLVDRPEASTSEWRWRVQAGFGQVALALNQVETAVAALREAAQARPADASIQKLLAEAYCKANLYPESAQAARQALLILPDQLDTILWFVDLMTRLGFDHETLTALVTATQIEPDQPAHWNRLARLQHHCDDDPAARESLAALLRIENLSADDLRQAAATYVLLGDLLDALACLERAVTELPSISAELLFEMSTLHQQLGQPEAALDILQRAIVADPDELLLHILEADLFVWLGRNEAARACLEKALLLQQKLAGRSDGDQILLSSAWASGDWLETALAPAAIHTRLVWLLYAAGELSICLNYAERGLELEPGNRALRVLAIQAARGLLSNRADTLLQAAGPVADDHPDRWSQALAAQRAEIALEAGEVVQAAGTIETGVHEIPEEAHLLAIQARLLSGMGDVSAARQALEAAQACLRQPVVEPVRPGPESNLWRAYQDTGPLSVAEAALDLEQWQTGLDIFKQYVTAHPNELRAHLRYARALVITAERQRLCEALRSQAHAPGQTALSPENQAGCEQALQVASRSIATAEINAWAARAKAVFTPGLQHAPALAKLAPSADHAAALMSVLRISKNASNAVRIYHHYPESPELLVQVALCYREIDPAKGIAAALKAVQSNPAQPLNHAALAALSEAGGDLPTAAEALENAISSWPDEPDWHVWAADLCLKTGQDTLALAHREKALALCPTRLDYALSLAQLHIDHGNASRAIEILIETSRVMPEEKQVWMTLAHAYLFGGSPQIALDCTARATELDPLDPAPLLLSGEIALQLGKPDLALEHARAAQAVAPAQPEVVLFHSRTLVQKGHLVEALAVLEKTLPQLSSSQPVLVERASLVQRLHGAAVALPLWIELSQSYPQDPTILSLLAQTQADCGDLKGAEHTAYAAYHLNPDQPQVNLLLGRLQHQAGQLDQSIHFLSEAIRLSYGDVDAYLDLGQSYLERREEAQALRTYQQAIKVAPRDYRPYYRAALVLREIKDYLSAETMLRRAAELSPDDLNIRRQLGAVVALNLVHNSQEVNSIL